MNALDWVILCVGLICVGRGMWRGAASQVFGIAGVLGGFLLATYFYEGLAVRLSQAFPKVAAIPVISFVTLFLLTWFCAGLMGFCLARLLRHTGLGFLDRCLGAAVGLTKAAVLGIVLVSMLTFFLSSQNPLLLKSYMTPHIQQFARIVIKATPDTVQRLFDRKRRELNRYWIDYEKNEMMAESQSPKGVKIKE